MFKIVTQFALTTLVVGLTLSPAMAQVSGPVVPGSGAPPLEELTPGRGSTYTEHLAATVNGPLALQMIENVLASGEVAAETGQFVQGEDGSVVAVFNIVPLVPGSSPARLVLVSNPGNEMTVVGRQLIKFLPDGAKTELTLVSNEFPDEVFEGSIKVDSNGNLLAVSDNMSGSLESYSTGTGILCVKRCYVQFLFGFPPLNALFWFCSTSAALFPALTAPAMAFYCIWLFYLKWFQLSTCISAC